MKFLSMLLAIVAIAILDSLVRLAGLRKILCFRALTAILDCARIHGQLARMGRKVVRVLYGMSASTVLAAILLDLLHKAATTYLNISV